MSTKTKLSTLWIVFTLNMILADVLSIFVELVNKNTLDGIIGEVTTTMAIAAIIINMPILLIYFSRYLSFKINRILNMVVAFLMILFVIGGGSLLPHYIICATLEVIVLLLIIIKAWKWKI
ncbi:DUF6326 family protein [uncultured Polaribacter sp.]|uniref:DUF6326 family protein n=1 Tax=uncultured Polaribacter sp. TaxID=174711 RepID=UPI002615BDAE|nr:DUF6326 family protein [uncultured Polaribacter sp.]